MTGGTWVGDIRAFSTRNAAAYDYGIIGRQAANVITEFGFLCWAGESNAPDGDDRIFKVLSAYVSFLSLCPAHL